MLPLFDAVEHAHAVHPDSHTQPAWDPMWLKIIVVLCCLFAGVFGVVIPFVLAKQQDNRGHTPGMHKQGAIQAYSLAFSGGLLLGLALCHMLAESCDKFFKLNGSGKEACFFASAGLVIMLTLQSYTYRIVNKDKDGEDLAGAPGCCVHDIETAGAHARRAPSLEETIINSPRMMAAQEGAARRLSLGLTHVNSEPQTTSNGAYVDLPSSPRSYNPHTPTRGNKLDGRIQAFLPTQISLLVALIVHSFIEGWALGLQKTPDQAFLMCFAICLHKAFAGYALGSAWASSGRTLLQSHHMIYFCLASPLGCIIASLVMEKASIVWTSRLNSLAAGTMLHVGAHEILAPILHSAPKMSIAVVAAVAGFVTITSVDHFKHTLH